MNQRVITGALLVIGLILVLWLGGTVFSVAICLAFVLAVREELQALEHAGYKPVHWVSYAYLLLSAPMAMVYSYVGIMPILTLCAFCGLIQVMRRPNPDLTDVMVTALPMLTVVTPAICIMGLATVEPRSLQLYFIVLLFALSSLGDIFAYEVGSRIGGKKLCPKISPKKTISGSIGGLVGSIFSAVLVGWIFQTLSPNVVFPPLWANLLVGLCGGVAGQTGDLFASLVKRHCGVKDFGNLLPGHGGALDRLDSIIFTAIVVYCYQVIFMM